MPNIKKEYENIVSASSFLEPSAAELVICVAIFGGLVLTNLSSQYTHNLLNLSQADFQGTFMYGTVHAFVSFISNKEVGYIMYFGFWLAIGLIIYFLASWLLHLESETVQEFMSRHYIRPKGTDRNSSIKEFVVDCVIKLVALIFVITFVIKGLPALDNWWKSHESTHSLVVYSELFIYSFLFMHIFVVLLRVFFLRPRVFGQTSFK